MELDSNLQAPKRFSALIGVSVFKGSFSSEELARRHDQLPQGLA